jgi:hypothetical protein
LHFWLFLKKSCQSVHVRFSFLGSSRWLGLNAWEAGVSPQSLDLATGVVIIYYQTDNMCFVCVFVVKRQVNYFQFSPDWLRTWPASYPSVSCLAFGSIWIFDPWFNQTFCISWRPSELLTAFGSPVGAGRGLAFPEHLTGARPHMSRACVHLTRRSLKMVAYFLFIWGGVFGSIGV